MSLPANFPVSLDALANPTATTNRDDAGFELDLVIGRIHDILEALEAKVGITASVPAAGGGVLRQTGAGLSAWGKLAAGDLADGSTLKLAAPSQTLSADAVQVVFNPISQTYTSLMLVGTARGSKAAASDTLYARFNGDAVGPYYHQMLYATAASAAGVEANNITWAEIAGVACASALGGMFTPFILYLPNYRNTGANRQWISENHYFTTGGAGTQQTRLTGGLYYSGSAITQITLAMLTAATNIVAGSQFSLYGLP